MLFELVAYAAGSIGRRRRHAAIGRAALAHDDIADVIIAMLVILRRQFRRRYWLPPRQHAGSIYYACPVAAK